MLLRSFANCEKFFMVLRDIVRVVSELDIDSIADRLDACGRCAEEAIATEQVDVRWAEHHRPREIGQSLAQIARGKTLRKRHDVPFIVLDIHRVDISANMDVCDVDAEGLIDCRK